VSLVQLLFCTHSMERRSACVTDIQHLQKRLDSTIDFLKKFIAGAEALMKDT